MQPPDPIAGLQQALNLTAAQVESVKTLMTQHDQTLQPALETIRTRQYEVQSLQSRASQEGNRLANAIVAVRNAEDQLKVIQDKYRADFNALLTPAQRQMVTDAQAAIKRIGPLTQMGLIDGPMPGFRGGMPGRGPNGPNGQQPQGGMRRGPNGPPRGGGGV